ncbi:MAG: hypothetical protein EXS05_00165 [Planctomycetaceae bacterium]|nr:hypothetical protein [Planctomycetaceae bacterium]
MPSVCEALRSRLQENWLSAAAAGWDPKCIVVVHRTAKGYTARLGRGSEGSSGCASLESEGGRVVARRIDLRGDADDWLTAAFPHELTHIVLADRFGGRQPPRWVDEGIAILAEPETKQLQRLRAFEAAEARRQIYSARELMAPAADRDARRRDAFYWQSASLVAHLVEQGTSEQFLTFVDALMRDGTEHALRQVYEIPSLAQLESRWRPQTLPGDRPESSLADHIAQITSARRLRD